VGRAEPARGLLPRLRLAGPEPVGLTRSRGRGGAAGAALSGRVRPGGTLLVNGSWQGDWKISQGGLEIRPFIRLSPADRDAIAAEGERLLGFADLATAIRDVRFVPVRSG